MYNHLDIIGNMFFKKSQTKIVKKNQTTAESIGFPYRAKGRGYYGRVGSSSYCQATPRKPYPAGMRAYQ